MTFETIERSEDTDTDTNTFEDSGRYEVILMMEGFRAHFWYTLVLSSFPDDLENTCFVGDSEKSSQNRS